MFDAIRDVLDDDWEVFHSAGLLVRDPGDGAQDDEVDFVLVHPERGVIALEVKGGGIECRHGEWTRPGLAGTPDERIPDPFTQSLDHCYSFRRKLEESDRAFARNLLLVHAVALPDVTVHELALAPDAPREILIDKADLRDDLPAAIDRVLAFHSGAREKRSAPGTDGATLIRDVLAPHVTLLPTLGDALRDEQATLIRLTYEQAAALRGLRHNRRVLLTGCAGSGKTMLALARAAELAADGQAVLFACFNKALCEDVKARDLAPGVDVYTFHGLCFRMAHVAGIELPDHDGPTPPEFFSHTLPDALVDAMAATGGRYDAILVDEAQDLRDDWLAALTCTLRDEDAGSLWLFMDDNQRVYDEGLTVPDGYARYDLTVNCRNTRAIHREVVKLYEGDTVPGVIGPEGKPIELIQTEDQAETVVSIVRRLIEEDDVAPQDIVVLSAHAIEKSAITAPAGAGFTFTKERGKPGAFVQLSSIRAFKGLESPVVILCELEDLDQATRDQQLYVGMSRATSYCVVVAPEAAS